jgi:hypothetical protein
MKDKEIDDVLRQMADAQPGIDPTLLDHISTSLGSGLQPAKTMPPSWVVAIGLVLVSATLAIVIAIVLGPHGIQKMTAGQRELLFAVLGLLTLLSAVLCVSEAIPGSRRPVRPGVLIVLGCAVLAATFAVLFHEYQTAHFVFEGMKCLIAGVAAAIPVGIANRLLLKRGYFVNRTAAGLAGGTLAGLAGITMLEIHCPNFAVPHLLVWHIAVLPLCAALGVLAGLARRPLILKL